MKKFILMMAAAVVTTSSFAQTTYDPDFVLGTREESPFGLMTDNTVRATFLGSGALIFGDNEDPMTDKRGRKIVLDSETDMILNNNSHIFMVNGTNIYGGPDANYPGASRSFANCSYLLMSHNSDGSVLFNSRSSEIFLQPAGGTVYVGKEYNSSLNTSKDELSVDGSATATGYCAAIKEISTTSYTLTNDDFTILVTGSSDVTLTLPTLDVEHGRMFNIKNLMASNKVTVVGADAGSNIDLTATNEGITIQMLYSSGSGTWTYHIISTM